MSKPNFIFIVADDLGYADLGCYGGRVPVSPALDALAAKGIRYVNGYSNSPVCSPTRFALMTGRYQYRLRGAGEEPLTGEWRGNPDVGLPPDTPNLASMLKAIGYKTALIGKWHLGYPPHFSPLKSGYDEHFGPLSGGVSYYSHRDRGGKHDLYENDESVDVTGQYLTDLLSDRAVAFVRERGVDKQPFLLSLNYTAPHWPWETRSQGQTNPEVDEDITHLDGGSIHIYHQMIREMDEGIGRLVDELTATGLLDNTLIVFTSDNGGERFSDNWPLVGGKMDLTEGGIRVPYIVHWPDRIKAHGAVIEQHCMTMDWTVTILEVAGLVARPGHSFDGVSMQSSFDVETPMFARPMFWRMKYRDQRAVRDGDWKYLFVDGHEYLFNVEVDARERANRAQREPALLNGLRERYEAWHATMPAVPLKARVSLVSTQANMPSR